MPCSGRPLVAPTVNSRNLTPLNEGTLFTPRPMLPAAHRKRKLQCSLNSCAATQGHKLETISDGKCGFVGKAERSRVQRTQLEIGSFVPQTAEFSSEIEVGGHGNFQATAV
jgi:hypothetical protein